MRVFGTIRATLKTGDKGVTVFHNLDADPPAPVNLWVGGGGLPARVGLGLKTAVKRDAVLCGATCRKIFVFPTYESVCV